MKKSRLLIMIAFLTATGLAGCGSALLKPTPESNPDVVVARSNNLDKRPGWVDETRVFWKEDNTVYFLGTATIPAAQRLEAAYRIAESDAKARVCQSVSNKINAIMQNSEEGLDWNTTQTRYSFIESCGSLVVSAVQPDRRYYEKVATTLDSGERVTRYHIFATVGVPESKLAELIHQSGQSSGLGEKFKKMVDDQWDKIVGGN